MDEATFLRIKSSLWGRLGGRQELVLADLRMLFKAHEALVDDHARLTAEFAELSSQNATLREQARIEPSTGECQYCGAIHKGTCPKIKSVHYYPDGSVQTVDFFPPAVLDSIEPEFSIKLEPVTISGEAENLMHAPAEKRVMPIFSGFAPRSSPT